MSESLRQWAEISFDVAYLITIWGLVALMAARRSRVEPENRKVSTCFLWAFALLAFGDTGHVGFRVVAYALGGLENNPLLISIGGLMTSLTVTLYYVALQMAWKERFKRRMGPVGGFLLLCAAVQLVVVVLAYIRWGHRLPPDNWFLLSPALLTVLGLGVATLIMVDAVRAGDRVFRNVAWMIYLGYLFFLPTVIWVRVAPMVGMLMIPKTVTYVVIAVIAYRAFYASRAEARSGAEA